MKCYCPSLLHGYLFICVVSVILKTSMNVKSQPMSARYTKNASIMTGITTVIRGVDRVIRSYWIRREDLQHVKVCSRSIYRSLGYSQPVTILATVTNRSQGHVALQSTVGERHLVIVDIKYVQ